MRLTPLFCLILPAALAGQDVPTTRLAQPEARFPESLSLIAGFRAIDATHAIAADALEGRVTLLDWQAGTLTDIGRQGGGPGEFGAPGRLFAHGDTTFMLDMGNRRLVAIVGTRMSSSTVSLSGPDGLPMIPQGVDARGRVYYDLAGIASPATAELVAQGRAPLLRWDPATNRTDTLGIVGFPPMPQVGQGEVRVQIGGGAYQPRDVWAVTPDGKVGIARTAPYHVEWLGGSQAVVGPEVPYRPIPVGTAEKNAWADRMANRGMMVSVENGRRSTRRAPRPNIDRMQWPDNMPPTAGTALTAPDGGLWVERSSAARDRASTYDVFDSRGRRVRQVVFPDGQRLLAVGRGFVMASRTDDDGLEWVERFRLAP